jgi:hypothetical protein
MPLRITNFGGLVPKASARSLPDDGAQTSDNLAAHTREFRPLAADSTIVAASGVTNPLAIWRLQRNADGSLNTDFTSASNWRVSNREVSAAKIPLNDDKTDRHVYTYNDGADAPRVIDATGDDRQLGVPAPIVAPTVVVNVVDEYTVEDRGGDLEAARTQVLNIVRSYATAVWRGATRPGTSTDGYLDRLSVYGFNPEDLSQEIRFYRLTGDGGTISDSYTALDDSTFSWVLDPLLPSFQAVTNGSTPSWGGASGTYHIGIPFAAYGLTYDLDTAAIRTQVEAIAMPGTSDGSKLFTTAQVDLLVDDLTAFADPAGDVVKPKIDNLAGAVATLKDLLDGGKRSSLQGTRLAFYSKTDVAAEITAAKSNWAAIIFNAADAVARSSTPADYIGVGNGA